LVSDRGVNVVRMVDANGNISRVAGNHGAGGFGGDGGSATAVSVAQIHDPFGLAPTPDGGFLIADSANNRIRKFFVGGNIDTVAGVTTPCDVTTNPCGDGDAAINAQLNLPQGVVSRPDGRRGTREHAPGQPTSGPRAP